MGYIDGDGVENAACALIRQAKKDFIRGAKVLYFHLGYIPTQKELLNDEKHKTLVNSETVRWMYDSWRFGESSVIEAWKNEAIMDHYRTLYLTPATILYKKKAPKNIQGMSEQDLSPYFTDQNDGKKLLENFIKARNYISQRYDADEIFHQWNVEAHARSYKVRLNSKRSAIQDTDYFKNKKTKREQNIEKARQLRDEGLTSWEIAKELGVTRPCVWNYLRS